MWLDVSNTNTNMCVCVCLYLCLEKCTMLCSSDTCNCCWAVTSITTFISSIPSLFAPIGPPITTSCHQWRNSWKWTSSECCTCTCNVVVSLSLLLIVTSFPFLVSLGSFISTLHCPTAGMGRLVCYKEIRHTLLTPQRRAAFVQWGRHMASVSGHTARYLRTAGTQLPRVHPQCAHGRRW